MTDAEDVSMLLSRLHCIVDPIETYGLSGRSLNLQKELAVLSNSRTINTFHVQFDGRLFRASQTRRGLETACSAVRYGSKNVRINSFALVCPKVPKYRRIGALHVRKTYQQLFTYIAYWLTRRNRRVNSLYQLRTIIHRSMRRGSSAIGSFGGA